MTLVPSVMRAVTAAMAGMATHGSTHGAAGSQKRSPSEVYGYSADTSSG